LREGIERANNAREIVKLVLTETRRRVLELQNGRAPPRKVSLGPRASGPPRIIEEPLLHAGEAHANERKVSITDFSSSPRGTETSRLHPLIALLGDTFCKSDDNDKLLLYLYFYYIFHT